MANLIRAHVAYSNAILAIGKEHEETINEIAKKIKSASDAGETVIRIFRPNQFGVIEIYLRHFGYTCGAIDNDVMISWSNPPKPC